MRRVYSKDRDERSEVVVDWNIGNTCSLSCSYCHRHFRAGTNRFPDLDKAILFVERVVGDHRKRTNRAVRFSFTGGEPTEWSDLPALCTHLKAIGALVEIKSNGTASVATWQALAPSLSSVILSLHHGADFEIFRAACFALREAGVGLSVGVAMLPEHFDVLLTRAETLRNDGFGVGYIPLYHDHTRRTRLLGYSPDQLAILFPTQVENCDIRIERDAGGEIGYRNSDDVIHRRANSFTGMRCAIGIDQFVVDQDGTIRGGWCRVGGALGNIHEGDFARFEEAVICTKPTCDNPLDLSVPKWREE